jgi:hypothetical protein
MFLVEVTHEEFWTFELFVPLTSPTMYDKQNFDKINFIN